MLEEIIYKEAKKQLIRLALKKILGTAIGGVKGFIIKKALDFLFDKIFKPLLKKYENYRASRKDVKEARKKIEEFKKAKNDKDISDSFLAIP